MWKLATVVFGLLALGFFLAFMTSYHQVGAWTIQDGANIAAIIGNFAVACSIFFIAAQLMKQSEQLTQQAQQAELQTQLAKASNSQSFVSISSEFVLALGTNPTVMSLWHTGGTTYETKTDENEKAQFKYLVEWWLTFYENVEYQNSCKLLDPVVYNAWRQDMKGFVERRCVEKVWDTVKSSYSDLFVTNFQPIIDERRRSLAAPIMGTTAADSSSDLSPESSVIPS